MTRTPDDTAALHASIAFARAFTDGDAEGANAMLMTLPAEQLPAFASGLAMWIRQACALPPVDPGTFFEACVSLVDREPREDR